MIYTTTLTVGKSGTSDAPITIRLADEPGRNGKAVIDGGLTYWPCQATGPSPYNESHPPGTRRFGIDLNGQSWIQIDGIEWGGIEVRNHNQAGVEFDRARNIRLANLHIHHNTYADHPDGSGIAISGDNILLEKLEIDHNGQDAIQGGDLTNFVLQDSYLHDHYCSHPDGIQLYYGTNRNLVIQRNVFANGFLQAIFLGERKPAFNSSTSDVKVYYNLIYNVEYGVVSNHTANGNWKVYNNTIVDVANEGIHLYASGGGMEVRNNILYNGRYALQNGVQSNNLFYRVPDAPTDNGSIEADPQFVDKAARNFQLQPSSPAIDRGIDVGLTQDHLGNAVPAGNGVDIGAFEFGASPSEPTSTPGPASTATPTVSTATPPATSPTPPSGSITVRMEAEGGELYAPMIAVQDPTASNGQYVHTPDQAGYGQGETHLTVELPQAGVYTVWGRAWGLDAEADSFWVSVDGGTEVLWDIPRGGWAWDRVSNRGGDDPVQFDLSAGLHTFVFRTRDDGSRLDVIEITNDPNYVPAPIASPTSTPMVTSTPTPMASPTSTPTMTTTPMPEIPGPILSIPSNIPVRTGQTVIVPVTFTGNGHTIATTVFSVDFDQACLAFDPTDSDVDGIPDAVRFSVPDAFDVSVTFDGNDPNGELDFVVADTLPPLTSLLDGVLATVQLTATCQPDPGTSMIAPVIFSDDPVPSYGDTGGWSVPGTAINGSVEIRSGTPGDCNRDQQVDAGDTSAVVLEIYDGDGINPADALNGTFPGDPVGCDANEDFVIDAGDISCTARLIFYGSGACGSEGDLILTSELLGLFNPPAPPNDPTLTIPDWVVAAPNGEVIVPIHFNAYGFTISSLVFSVDYDERWLTFDPTDSDGDGIPDAVTFRVSDELNASVAFDGSDADGELDFFVADFLPPLSTLPDGTIVTVKLDVVGNPPGTTKAVVNFSQAPAASFGDTLGQSIPGTTEGGFVLIPCPGCVSFVPFAIIGAMDRSRVPVWP